MASMEFFTMVSSSKAAGVGAGGAIFGALYAAAVGPDILPVMGGIGIGVIGIGWSIFSAGRDRRVTTLAHEIETLQRICSDKEIELEACREKRRHLTEEVERLSARVARLTEESGDHATLPD